MLIGVETSKKPGRRSIVSLTIGLWSSYGGMDGNGRAVSVQSAQVRDNAPSSRKTLCLKYLGRFPRSSHCLSDFAIRFSVSCSVTFFAKVFILALICCVDTTVDAVEPVRDVGFCYC